MGKSMSDADLRALADAVGETLSWVQGFVPTLLPEVVSVTFGVTDAYGNGLEWDAVGGQVLLRDGIRVPIDFEGTPVEGLLEPSAGAGRPQRASDVLVVPLEGCVAARPMVLIWEQGGEPREERGVAWELIKLLAKIYQELNYGHADLAGPPGVFGVDAKGERFPLTVEVDRGPYDSSDYSHRTVTVTWPSDGREIKGGYSIDGRA